MTQTRQGQRRSCVHLLSLPCASSVLRCSLCFLHVCFLAGNEVLAVLLVSRIGCGVVVAFATAMVELLLFCVGLCLLLSTCISCLAVLGLYVGISCPPVCVCRFCFACSFIFGKTFSACIFYQLFCPWCLFDIRLSAGTCDAGKHLQRMEILGFV